MLRPAKLIAILLAICSPASAQPPPQHPLPVIVTSAAQERTARNLVSAVLKALKRDQRFAVVERAAPGAITIALPAGIGWERRLDWTEIHYQARVTSAAGQSRVVAGYCWNFNLSVCAKQITDAAAEMGAS
jgi:ABC-type nitrate/sulfonate/bicarbonate transport system substrate-binding protein